MRSAASPTLPSFLAALFLVSGHAGAATPAAAVRNVRIADTSFLPKVVRIRAGTTLVWTNEDEVVHTVTSGTTHDDGKWVSSGLLSYHTSFRVRFTKPGTYPYYCKIHFYDDSMHGTVVVTK